MEHDSWPPGAPPIYTNSAENSYIQDTPTVSFHLIFFFILKTDQENKEIFSMFIQQKYLQLQDN